MPKINEITRRSPSQQIARLQNKRAAIMAHEAPPTLPTQAKAALGRQQTEKVQRISSWIRNIAARSRN